MFLLCLVLLKGFIMYYSLLVNVSMIEQFFQRNVIV